MKECRCRGISVEIPPELQSMLDAEHGPTKQKAARLVVDLAASAGASNYTMRPCSRIRCQRNYWWAWFEALLSDLSGDPEGTVSIPTTLNSAVAIENKLKKWV